MHIPVSHGRLEAQLREAEAPLRGCAVICHPHPLFGGTMHTKAVFRTAQALNEVGFHALRFNFRGVGTSTGEYGEGVTEEEDVEAALDWAEQTYPELPQLLGGFSFGSMVALKVGVRDPRPRALFGLGLAFDKWDYSFLKGLEKPLLVVQGEDDEFGAGTEVERVVSGLSSSITTHCIPKSDHYFHDHFDELQEAVREYFTTGPGGLPFPSPDAG